MKRVNRKFDIVDRFDERLTEVADDLQVTRDFLVGLALTLLFDEVDSADDHQVAIGRIMAGTKPTAPPPPTIPDPDRAVVKA